MLKKREIGSNVSSFCKPAFGRGDSSGRWWYDVFLPFGSCFVFFYSFKRKAPKCALLLSLQKSKAALNLAVAIPFFASPTAPGNSRKQKTRVGVCARLRALLSSFSIGTRKCSMKLRISHGDLFFKRSLEEHEIFKVDREYLMKVRSREMRRGCYNFLPPPPHTTGCPRRSTITSALA